MPVKPISPAQARRLLPLLHQVHDLHLTHQPARYAKLPDDAQMAAYLETWLSMPDVHALGYVQAGDLLGYAIYEVEHRPATPFRAAETRALLEHICVDAAHRKKGIGLALMRAVQTEALGAGARVLAATYGAFNTASAKLMSRAGLTPVMHFAERRSEDAPE